MSKRILITCAALLCLAAPVTSSAAEPGRRTIIYDGVVTEVAGQPASVPATKSPDLWITLTDLKRATRFELKPKGVCRDELCFPIPKARRESFVAKRGSATWFNLSEFAKLVRQPIAYDLERAAWFSGRAPTSRTAISRRLRHLTFACLT